MDREETATVLVVDDEAAVLDAFGMYLESAGHEVITAANGGEAIVELDNDIDVVLLDRRMPGMSGDEVLTHVREWHANCRVAMVTAVDPGPDILDMPFDDYLTKPVGKEELLAVVDRFRRFDRYEELATEYHAVARKYAVLKSHGQGAVEDGTKLDELRERRGELLAEIDELVSEFDDDVADVFRRIEPATG